MLISDFDGFDFEPLKAGHAYTFTYDTNSGEVQTLGALANPSLAMALATAEDENRECRQYGDRGNWGVILLDAAGYIVTNLDGHVINFVKL